MSKKREKTAAKKNKAAQETKPPENLALEQEKQRARKKKESAAKKSLKKDDFTSKRKSPGLRRGASFLDHPMIAPLLFSLLFSLLFVAILNPKKEAVEKIPALAERCFKELQKPFMIEEGASRITCLNDKSGLIFYYSYEQKENTKSWEQRGGDKIIFYNQGKALFCLQERCLRGIFTKDGSRSEQIKKQDVR